MNTMVATKQDFISLLEKFDKNAKHLHTGLWTEKVVLIDEHSTFMRLQHTTFSESVPLLKKSQISYPLVLTAETPKDFLNLDIKITKTRDGCFILDFEPTPMRPVKDFLIREYEMHLATFVTNLRKGYGKVPEKKKRK
tara:strand:+ start:1295 stop:1708 length:414 start_codon:yes stop_codon:yes gene_type:complete